MSLLEIDGQAGGGQIIRSAVSLSALSGRAIRVTNVRGSRSNPGLRAQHLTAVRAAARVSGAKTAGVDLGSEEFEFSPGDLRGGQFCLDVGTAGSVALVFETLLPLAYGLEEPLTVTVSGGTDVRWAPPLAYYSAKLDFLREFGFHAAVTVDRPGFYPAGGGVATLELAPSTPSPIRLPERGPVEGVRIHSLAADELRQAEVAERSLRAVVGGLPDDVAVRRRTFEYADAHCPGASVVATVDCETGLGGAGGLGEKDKPAEELAEELGEEVAESVREFLDSGGAVDEHLADQLVVPLALGGGRVRIPRVTDHVETNVATVAAFGYDVELDRSGDGTVLARSPD